MSFSKISKCETCKHYKDIDKLPFTVSSCSAFEKDCDNMTIALGELRKYVICGIISKDTPQKELNQLKEIDNKYFKETGKHIYKFPE